MLIGVPRETYPGESRVALTPGHLAALQKAGHTVRIESLAGAAAGYPDDEYRAKGAEVTASRQEVFAADAILQLRAAGANPTGMPADRSHYRRGQIVMAMCDPLGAPQACQELAETGITLFSLELIPRITRAQSMDVLSSMATVAGYRAVLLAATHLPRMFPMLMTAAGTISAARVFIIGAGVAGLQAIATARRLGAVVEAYDVRSAVKEQIQSLGAKFVEMPLEAGAAEGTGGYAKQMDEDFYRRQREFLTQVVARNDVVITTAAVPGKKAPTLVTKEMVAAMAPGSVVVDVAAERGGNCELTEPGRTIKAHDVTILGPTNLPAEIPYHASQMFAKNVTTFLLHVYKGGALNLEDQISRETLVLHEGQVAKPQVRELLGLPPASTAIPLAETK